VDARDKRGHDEEGGPPPVLSQTGAAFRDRARRVV